LIFSLLDITEVPFGMQYLNMYNAFFRDLPASSSVFHSSLLTVKSVNLVVAHDGFLCVTRNCPYFHSGYFFTEVLFKHFLIRTAVLTS